MLGLPEIQDYACWTGLGGKVVQVSEMNIKEWGVSDKA